VITARAVREKTILDLLFFVPAGKSCAIRDGIALPGFPHYGRVSGKQDHRRSAYQHAMHLYRKGEDNGPNAKKR
jgi:hypothetical protein